jgi:membrane-associated phospholipid phosphatase
MPDLANIAKYAVGGFSDTQGGYLLVSQTICTSTDKSLMDDGFRSFPSGHSSFSASGLIYLSLYLASKLAITIPFLSPSEYSADASRFAAFPSRAEKRQIARNQKKSQDSGEPTNPSGHNDAIIATRNQAAAPPLYLLVLAAIPFFASIYISSTRYSDFRHHGFDIIFGYLIGAVAAILSFRFYHLPISQGAGWSWGPRSRDRSFWAGIGVGSYSNNRPAVEEGVQLDQSDLESGISTTGGNPSRQ